MKLLIIAAFIGGCASRLSPYTPYQMSADERTQAEAQRLHQRDAENAARKRIDEKHLGPSGTAKPTRLRITYGHTDPEPEPNTESQRALEHAVEDVQEQEQESRDRCENEGICP